jgi:hypothetical protein
LPDDAATRWVLTMTGVVCAAVIGNDPNFAAGRVVCATVIANDRRFGRN